MASAKELTAAHERIDISVDKLLPNTENPNVMSDAEFNMLYDNVEQMGITDPILVRPLDDGTYRVVGGHHRLEVAKLQDFEEVPCTVIRNEQFDDDMEEFQMVRMNVIHGQMAPEKFLKMYERLSKEYTDQILQESFGFVNESEFKKLVSQMKESLPPEMQDTFVEAAKEIKTIDGLSKLLHEMFTRHGDTLPYGYMVFDYGGKDSVWLRMEAKGKKALFSVGDLCVKNERTMDAVVGELFTRFVSNPDLIESVINATPKREIPEEVELPTLDFLDAFED